jgi:hypothetical protein
VEYQLVFDVADRIPDIALGIAALVALALVVGAGLWAFDDLLSAWPLTAGVAISIGALQAVNDQSLGASAMFLLVPSLVCVAEVLRGRFPSLSTTRVPRGAGPTMFATFLLFLDAMSGIGRLGAIGLSQQLRSGGADQIEGNVTGFFEGTGARTSVSLSRTGDSATQTGWSHPASTGPGRLVARSTPAGKSASRRLGTRSCASRWAARHDPVPVSRDIHQR